VTKIRNIPKSKSLQSKYHNMLNFEAVFLLDFLFSSAQSYSNFEVFLVYKALPLATCHF